MLFAVAAFHQLAIDQPAGIGPALGACLNGFSLAGLGAWVFTQIIAPFLRPRAFVLDRIDRHPGAAELTLRPMGRTMRWRPVQFAFVSAPEAGMGEAHPFTIASAPQADGTLRFGIKALGGWTRALPDQLAPFNIAQAELFFCGPAPLRDAILSGLRAMGKSPRRDHCEAFELR